MPPKRTKKGTRFDLLDDEDTLTKQQKSRRYSYKARKTATGHLSVADKRLRANQTRRAKDRIKVINEFMSAKAATDLPQNAKERRRAEAQALAENEFRAAQAKTTRPQQRNQDQAMADNEFFDQQAASDKRQAVPNKKTLAQNARAAKKAHAADKGLHVKVNQYLHLDAQQRALDQDAANREFRQEQKQSDRAQSRPLPRPVPRKKPTMAKIAALRKKAKDDQRDQRVGKSKFGGGRFTDSLDAITASQFNQAEAEIQGPGGGGPTPGGGQTPAPPPPPPADPPGSGFAGGGGSAPKYTAEDDAEFERMTKAFRERAKVLQDAQDMKERKQKGYGEDDGTPKISHKIWSSKAAEDAFNAKKVKDFNELNARRAREQAAATKRPTPTPPPPPPPVTTRHPANDIVNPTRRPLSGRPPEYESDEDEGDIEDANEEDGGAMSPNDPNNPNNPKYKRTDINVGGSPPPASPPDPPGSGFAGGGGGYGGGPPIGPPPPPSKRRGSRAGGGGGGGPPSGPGGGGANLFGGGSGAGGPPGLGGDYIDPGQNMPAPPAGAGGGGPPGAPPEGNDPNVDRMQNWMDEDEDDEQDDIDDEGGDPDSDGDDDPMQGAALNANGDGMGGPPGANAAAPDGGPPPDGGAPPPAAAGLAARGNGPGGGGPPPPGPDGGGVLGDLEEVLGRVMDAYSSKSGGRSFESAYPKGTRPSKIPGERELEDKGKLVEEKAPEIPGYFHGNKLGYVHDEAKPTLRPQWGLAGANEVVPDAETQIRSDVMFDMFSVVQPGFGEGSSNKMFLQQQARDKHIRFAGNMYTPNNWLGNINYQHPMPWQWQSVKNPYDVNEYMQEQLKRVRATQALIMQHGEGSVHSNGKDTPQHPTARSASGLPRDINSPFEPTITLEQHRTPFYEVPGKDLDEKQGYRRLFSWHRDPVARDRQFHNGGATLSRRRALEVVLP